MTSCPPQAEKIFQGTLSYTEFHAFYRETRARAPDRHEKMRARCGRRQERSWCGSNSRGDGGGGKGVDGGSGEAAKVAAIGGGRGGRGSGSCGGGGYGDGAAKTKG